MHMMMMNNSLFVPRMCFTPDIRGRISIQFAIFV